MGPFVSLPELTMNTYRYLCFSFIMLCCVFYFARAQQERRWEELDGLQGGYVVSSLIDSNGMWWIGLWGGVYSSTDQGSSWTRRGLPAYNVYDLVESPRGTILAATSGGLMRSTSYGVTWDTLYQYYATHVKIHPGGAVIIGRNDGVFFSLDHGVSFAPTNDGLVDREILSMLIHPSGRMFVGTHSGIYVADSVRGKWFHVNDAVASGFCDAFTVTPSGIVYASLFNKPIAVTTDRGNSWTALMKMPTLGYIPALFAGSDGSLTFGVDYGGGCVHGDVPPGGTKRGFYRSMDQGNTWERVPIGVEEPKIRTINSAGNGEWLLGTTEGVICSQDDMRTWQESNAGLNAVLAYSLVDDTRDRLFIAGPCGIRRSDDRGITWKNIGNGLPDRWGDAVARSSDGTLFCAPNSDTVWTSTDNGDTWNTGGVPGASPTVLISGLEVDSSGVLYAWKGWGLGISVSADRGVTWTTHLPDLWCSSIKRGRNGEVFAVMEDGLYVSTDHGDSWVGMFDATASDKKMVLRTRDGAIFLGDFFGRITRSTDNGRSWSPVAPITNGNLIDLEETRDGIYACYSGEGIFGSSDDGRTWTARNDGLSNQYPTLLTGTSDGHLYLGTWGGGIALYETLTGLESPPHAENSSVILHPNYPNPFTGRTLIPYTLARPSRLRIDVTDATGRVVDILFDGEQSGGTYLQTWDAGILPCGSYRYRITAHGVTRTRPITLVH